MRADSLATPPPGLQVGLWGGHSRQSLAWGLLISHSCSKASLPQATPSPEP